MSEGFLIVTTSVGALAEARVLAHALVEQRLAACVQITPIESVYRWQGRVETAPEQLLVCKIRAADYAAVEMEIRSRHPYDVPEIIALPLVAGSPTYLSWIADATTRSPDDAAR